MVSARQILGGKASPTVYAIEPEDPVLEAIQAMAEHSIGALLVIKGTELVGIVSERDYARKVILLGRSSSETPVWQIMSAPVLSVHPDTTVTECMQLMTEQRVRHLPVVEHGNVLGVLSIGDIVRALLEEQQRTIRDLENYIRS
jgi:CBS domain-containing protein